MHSLKNTVVAILLLGATYGVYQVLTTPDPTVANQQDEFLDSMVEDYPEQNEDASSSGVAMTDRSQDNGASIPSALLNPNNEFATDTRDGNSFAPLNNSTPGLLPSQPGKDNNLASVPNDRSLLDSLKNEIRNGGITPQSRNDSATEFSPSDSRMVPIQKNNFASNIGSRSGENASSGFATPNEVGVYDPNVKEAGSNSPITLGSTWPQVHSMVQQSEFRSALVTLSRFYHDPSLNQNERSELLDWLDQLAAKVIYSNEHHLRSTPYIVQPNDTIIGLSEKWQVPAQLIFNINQSKIPDWNNLQAGVELKMIGGPFHAEVDSIDQTMTLFVKNLYAGRFAIQTGRQGTNLKPGVFPIVGKTAKGNKFGNHWIGLENGSCLHAVSGVGTDSCFAMTDRQAREIFAILGKNSTVRVLR